MPNTAPKPSPIRLQLLGRDVTCLDCASLVPIPFAAEPDSGESPLCILWCDNLEQIVRSGFGCVDFQDEITEESPQSLERLKCADPQNPNCDRASCSSIQVSEP